MLHGWVRGEWSRRARACAGSVAWAGAEGGDSWKKWQLPGSRGCQMQEAGAGTGLLFFFFSLLAGLHGIQGLSSLTRD